jgi:hypothetical protein
MGLYSSLKISYALKGLIGFLVTSGKNHIIYLLSLYFKYHSNITTLENKTQLIILRGRIFKNKPYNKNIDATIFNATPTIILNWSRAFIYPPF